MEELDAKFLPIFQEAALIEGILPFAEGKSLPCLNVYIQEALRLHPPAGGALLERVGLPQGATICGNSFLGTQSSLILAYLMHRHKPTFGEDTEEYRPERWLDNGREVNQLRLTAMNRSLFIIGIGHHTCLGKNIGLLELHKTVPTVLRCFDMSLENPSSKPNIANDVGMGIEDLNIILKRRYISEAA